MRNRFDEQLEKLNAELITMGALCEQAITIAINALLYGNDDDKVQFNKVHETEREIDQKERDIENLCMRLLLQQQPVAGDLRKISSALKMISDMERIGDHAADISEIELMLENLPTLSCAPIRQMATETSVMLIKSLEAFAQRDEEKANWVIGRDDVVDDLFDTVKSELIEAIRQNADNGEAATDLLMAAKYFERIGDHATNIAQWAIFSITGEMPKD